MEIVEKQNDDIKLKGVKVNNDIPLELKSKVPNSNVFFNIFCGGAGSGKTSLVINLVTKIYKKKFDKIYLWTASPHTLPESFTDKLSPKRIFTDISAKQVESVGQKNKEKQESALFIFDDMISSINKDKDLKNVIKNIIYNRRHMRIYIMLITQKLKEIPLSMRVASDGIYWYNFKNKKEAQHFYDDYVNLDKDEWHDLVKYMIDHNESGHDFMFLKKHGKDKYYRNFNELIFSNE